MTVAWRVVVGVNTVIYLCIYLCYVFAVVGKYNG